jgi:phosphate starvation-inducible PhoH-like protein
MMKSVRQNDITFVFGPAGTGKTHVAVGLAVRGLQNQQFDRLILTRPLVSVGKDMGFLPGGIEEKVGPYVRPCFDELRYYLSYNDITSYVNDGTIEIAPLSMMRGRTFRRCLILLDEAQNAVRPEVKSLLTRIGEGSRMILAGDPQQSDLASGAQGAFKDASEDLTDLLGVGVICMGNNDIVRHKLIKPILQRLR